LLRSIILEITEITNSYLHENTSLSINTVAKRSEFTKFIIEKASENLGRCLIRL